MRALARSMAFAIAFAVMSWPAGAARAQAPALLSDSDLAGVRGGFVTANGVTFDFGAVVRTYVGGQLALESRLTWSGAGAVSERRFGEVPGAIDLATALDEARVGGLDLSGLGAAEGLLITDGNGSTALIQTVQGGVRNLIVNNANGRDLRQEIEVTLTLPDLATLQQGYAIERLGSLISQDINASLSGALRR